MAGETNTAIIAACLPRSTPSSIAARCATRPISSGAREAAYIAELLRAGQSVALNGQLPFSGDHPGAVLMAHLQPPPPDPRRFAPALPDAAVQALLRALAKDPDERYRRTAEFGEALKAALG